MITFSIIHKLMDVTANPNLRSTKRTESIQRPSVTPFPDKWQFAFRLRRNARDKMISSTLVKSRSAVMISKARLTREKKFKRGSQHTADASPLSSGVPKKMRLRRFSPGDEEDETTVSGGIWRYVHTSGTVIFAHVPTTLIYVAAATIVDSDPYARSPSSPFSRPSASACSLAAALSGGNALLRSAYINGRPKGRSMEWRCWQVGPRREMVWGPWQCSGYKNLRKAVPLTWDPAGFTARAEWGAITFYLSAA